MRCNVIARPLTHIHKLLPHFQVATLPSATHRPASSLTKSAVATTRTAGLIGGFSWQTTAIYYEEINKHVNAKRGGIHSANLLIRSIDYEDLASLVGAKDYVGMTRLLCQCGMELRAANAQALVLCANVVHKAAEQLEETTGLPVLHIVDFTARQIVDQGFKKVGLLATRAVMEEDFYIRRLQRFGLEVVVPNSEFRADADGMIFQDMSKPEIPEPVKVRWRSAYRDLLRDHQVDCIILGCTELRLVFGPEDLTAPTFETTVLHARGIAEWVSGHEGSS
ncbi:hypothetical protein AYO21_11209 [Fonsecaea monophora]|uniref:Aspartate racemase n=1 Tax=Fonsecaea monophora TaxID=254056 RepID=A0A177ERI1_9EURO|nr:hypothetical protein AYO21_11209 [Fonsecaea monophora]OAG34613.1 hypothetical protein AYO21_11209 [Fonsecaea monophora]